MKSVKAVQDGMPFIVQMGMGCTGGKNLQIREFGLTGRNSSFPPVIQGRLLGGEIKLRQIILSSHLLERWYPFSLILLTI